MTKLNRTEQKKYKEVLLRMRESLSGDAKALEVEALKESEQDFSVDHMADHGSDNFEQEFNLNLIENVEDRLREINEALERIQEGVFGTCEECQKSIPKMRLRAIPYAKYCIECQRKNETETGKS